MTTVDLPTAFAILSSLLIVGIGGALGAGSRFVAGKKLRILPTAFPIGTLFVNILGTFLSGFFSVVVTGNASLFLITGFCGGFTTFATFSSDTVVLLRTKKYPQAILNIIVNVGGCFLGMNVGVFAAQYAL